MSSCPTGGYALSIPNAYALFTGGRLLTDRELECLQLTAFGHTTKDIARLMGISWRTVNKKRHAINVKLGARNSTEAVAIAMRARWVR